MDTPKKKNIKTEVALLPLLPGVYQFVNKQGTVIYVGKAKSLRKRVASYFLNNGDHSSKVRVMVSQIDSIRHIVVGSEYDALLLENNLIKELQPRYNILLKDDKSYPWIVIRNEPFARVESTRKVIKDGSRYFGPYSSISMQRAMLDVIRSVYQLRTCKLNLAQKNIDAGKYSVCLEYHIGNCKGPCIGNQTEQEYNLSIGMIAELLRGETRKSRLFLRERMETEASNMHFEEAQRYKQRLEALDNYVSKSIIVSDSKQSFDIFTLLLDQTTAYCNFVRVKHGAVINTFTSELSTGVDTDLQSILTRAIQLISERLSGPLASEVLVEYMPEETLFPNIKFTIPRRGEKLKLIEFSLKGAKIYKLEKLKNLEITDPKRHSERILEAMQKALYMKESPRHIECFDNSNLQGTNPVASCVVFRDCKPSRKEYRHFNIKTVIGANDFASMQEIIHRRYSRLLSEGQSLPDLIVVDGGKGQLSSAYGVLKNLGIADQVKIIGLAKRIEEVFFPGDSMPYYLEKTGEPLRVLMHLRDEAHRFGITFHRQKRSLAFIKSELESIEGIGKQSATALLRHFKTISAISKASKQDIEALIGAKRAEAIITHFANKDEKQND